MFKKLTVVTFSILVFALSSFAAEIETASIRVLVDGKPVEISLGPGCEDTREIAEDEKTTRLCGGAESADWEISVSALMNSDPFILWSFGATNLSGAPMAFAALFSTPVVGGPYNRLSASFSGSVTDLLGNGGAVTGISSTSALVLPSGSVVFAPGPCTTPSGPAPHSDTCGPYGPTSVFFAPYFPVSMSTDILFTVSARDSASFTGATILDLARVPEPATFTLLGVGFLAAAVIMRRKKQ